MVLFLKFYNKCSELLSLSCSNPLYINSLCTAKTTSGKTTKIPSERQKNLFYTFAMKNNSFTVQINISLTKSSGINWSTSET